MFHRVLYENWHDLVPVIAFVLTFAVFLAAFTRAILMRKDTAAAMSLLPLDDMPSAQVHPDAKVPATGKAGASEIHREPCHGNCTGCGCSSTK